MSKDLAILLKYRGNNRLMMSGNRLLKEIDSEVCHPRCVFKLNGEVNSIKTQL